MSAVNRRGRVHEKDPLLEDVIDLEHSGRASSENNGQTEQGSSYFYKIACRNRLKSENNT